MADDVIKAFEAAVRRAGAVVIVIDTFGPALRQSAKRRPSKRPRGAHRAR
jgi:hypothetical protein